MDTNMVLSGNLTDKSLTTRLQTNGWASSCSCHEDKPAILGLSEVEYQSSASSGTSALDIDRIVVESSLTSVRSIPQVLAGLVHALA